MIPQMKNKPYTKQLNELNLFCLEKHSLCGDLTEAFKMFRGHVHINVSDFDDDDRGKKTARNIGLRIFVQDFRSEESKHFSFSRIISRRNSPSQHKFSTVTQSKLYDNGTESHLHCSLSLIHFILSYHFSVQFLRFCTGHFFFTSVFFFQPSCA